MSFYENPVVDPYSKNSEESVLAVKTLFSQKKGFICRTEAPDFGVDEDVELMVNSCASGKKFAVQIKSVEQIKTIQKNAESFISLQFKTSRLGYLCRRQPAYGIIIIYDDNTQITYYDFVEDIVGRLNDQQDSEKWKNQGTVNINIPISNILSNEAVQTVYTLMLERHKNHLLMVKTNGGRYNIPVFDDDVIGNKIDLNDPKQISKLLKELGCSALDYREIKSIQDLLSTLPTSEITNSKELVLLMAIVSCEMGNYIDAEYYLKRAQLLKNYSKVENDNLLFTKYKLDFVLGKIDHGAYISFLHSLLESSDDERNSLAIRINIALMNSRLLFMGTTFDKSSFNEIRQIFEDIKSSTLPDKEKYELTLQHAFNLYNYAIRLLIESLSSNAIKERMGITDPLNKKVLQLIELQEVLRLPNEYAETVLIYAQKNDDPYLMARAAFQMAYYFFGVQFNLSTMPNSQLSIESKLLFSPNLENLFKAIKIFNDLQLNKDSYDAHILAHELLLLHQLSFEESIDSYNIDDLVLQIDELGNKHGIPKFESTVKKAFQSRARLSGLSGTQILLELTDADIEDSAESIIQNLGLPVERKKYVVQDFKNTKLFHEKKPSESFELLQDLSHKKSHETYYAQPLTYVVNCELCNMQSPPTKNINDLLIMMRYHVCRA